MKARNVDGKLGRRKGLVTTETERRTEDQKKAEKDQNMRVKKQCDEANE